MADAQSKRMNAAKSHIGTMGWSYSFWQGDFYPQDMSPKNFLAYYSKKLNSVEVDSTFYRVPTTKTLLNWKNETPDGFTFSLKFPAKITHLKKLKDCQEETRFFLDRAKLLEEKIGVLLLQLPPTFSQQHLLQLKDYLKILPKSYRYAVEVRDKSLLNEEVYALLRDNRAVLAWVDAARMPLITESADDYIYLRWEGNRKVVKGTLGKIEIDRTPSIREWAERLNVLLRSGKEIFGYFSKYYSGFPPADAEEIMKSMQQNEKSN